MRDEPRNMLRNTARELCAVDGPSVGGVDEGDGACRFDVGVAWPADLEPHTRTGSLLIARRHHQPTHLVPPTHDHRLQDMRWPIYHLADAHALTCVSSGRIECDSLGHGEGCSWLGYGAMRVYEGGAFAQRGNLLGD